MRLHALRPGVRLQLPAKSLLWAVTLALLALLALAVAQAEPFGEPIRKDGLLIYYGVLPGALVAKAALDSSGPHMSEARARAPGGHHLIVALFEEKTNQRIVDATVTARVVPLGGAPEEKRLAPMHINETTTYGQFFRFDADTPYVVHLRIRRHGHEAQDIEAQFRYQHPGR